MTTKYPTKWICTDPSILQYGRELGPTTFEFREFNRWEYLNTFQDLINMYNAKAIVNAAYWVDEALWCEMVIDLRNYTREQLQNYIQAFSLDMDTIKETFPIEWEFIIAECIFETDMITESL